MNVIKLLGQATQLTTTPDTVDSGERILCQHNHAGGNAHLIIHKNAGGDVLGSFYLAPHRPVVIDKQPTDTLETENSVTDIYATSIAHMG